MWRSMAIGMIATVGCGGENQPALWRDCDAAFAAVASPLAPSSWDPIVPIEAGRSMPVLRITEPTPDAESLANRALATACVLMGGDVRATEALPQWAEQVVAGEDDPEVGGVFDDANLWLAVKPTPTVAMSFEVGQRTEEDLEGDEVPTETARGTAKGVVAELVQRRLIADLETTILSASFDRRGDTTFGFSPEVAGIPVFGMWVLVTIDRNGERRSIEIHAMDVEVVGEAVAAIDESTAELRFLELAQSVHPELSVFLTDWARVVYLTPFESASEVEPVWYGQWQAGNAEGVVGPPQSTSLSLTDPNAPLVPYAPPE